MKAILVDERQNLFWTDVPDPVPNENEVLVQIHAAALNRADLLQRAGKYPPPPGWPEWMGLEAAGIVLRAPANSRWKPGDKVCALLGGGGYAEKIAVPQDMVLPVPRGLSMVEAAALPEVFATSWLNLRYEADLKPGETVFIQAGASGLGIAAIQTAKLMGATVVTSIGSDDKAEFVRKLGADDAVNRRTEDPSVLFERHSVNVALDCVGGSVLGGCIGEMAIGGRWILISTLGGETAEIPLRPILKRAITLKGSTLRSRTNEMKGKILADLERELWPAITAGTIRPVIHAVLPVERAADAHAILQSGKNTGKVVLTIGH
jgi:putative NAD(P)H quinone oxidoreductase, PIG3 family